MSEIKLATYSLLELYTPGIPLLKHVCWAEKMSQQLSEPETLPDNQIPPPAPKSDGSQLPTAPALGNPMSSSDLLKHCHTWHTDTSKMSRSLKYIYLVFSPKFFTLSDIQDPIFSSETQKNLCILDSRWIV